MTVNLGVRWEFYKPPTPAFPGGFSNYDPSNNTLVIAGIGGNPSTWECRRDTGISRPGWHRLPVDAQDGDPGWYRYQLHAVPIILTVTTSR